MTWAHAAAGEGPRRLVRPQKAVASLVYGLLTLATSVPHRTLITQVTVFTVLASTLAHSATQHAGTRWLTRSTK
ncbi:MAG TPA: hypothetical protein VI365_23195 [Trebonia sp.]